MTGYKLFAMAQLVTITPLLVYEKKNYSQSKDVPVKVIAVSF